jgi:hypothetical protein
MVIDPMAAVPQASLSQNARVEPAAQPTETAASRVDLFDYALQHGSGTVGFDGLSRAEQANRLANPATMGDRILSGLDGFSQRSQEVGKTVAAMEKGAAPGAAKGTGTPASGPAEAPLSNAESFRQSIVTVGDIFDFAIETQLVERAADQATSSVNTLVKGQ